MNNLSKNFEINDEHKCIVIEDGVIKRNSNCYWVWNGIFSGMSHNGNIVMYLSSLKIKDCVFIIPFTDGNINRCSYDYFPVSWKHLIQPYIHKCKKTNKKLIICTLAQVYEEPDVHYLYMPLDDNIFENGLYNLMSPHYVPWEQKSNKLCYRGSYLANRMGQCVRSRMIRMLLDYPEPKNCKLCRLWNNDQYTFMEKELFAEKEVDRIPFQEFFKYKIFFILDGVVIASNHMWGFGTGCIPFMITNAKFWFKDLIKPNIHYISVKYDLSDLFEKIEWVKNNDSEAQKIAENAVELSKYIFSSEFQKYYLTKQINEIIHS
jgi:hypothetical protein